MAYSDRLVDRLEDVFEASERERLARGMAGDAEQAQRGVVEDWIRNIVIPKLEILSAKFPNGTPPTRHGSLNHVSVAFLPSADGLLQAVVSVGLAPRSDAAEIQVIFRACAISELPPGTQERRAVLPAGPAELRRLNR